MTGFTVHKTLSTYEQVVKDELPLQILLDPATQLTVAAGDHWGFATTTLNGIVAYNAGSDSWCGGTTIPSQGATLSLAQNQKPDTDYAITLGYDHDEGK